MRITKIESQTKNSRRKNIYADGEFVAGVSDETLLRAGLRTGDEISDERLKVLIQEEETSGAKQVALRFLAHRPRTAKEIRDKLREKEFAEEEIKQTIETLERTGLLNDAEFARMYIRDALAAKPTGPSLLKRKLLLLGVEKSIVNESVQQAFSEVDDTAAALEAGRKFLKKSTATRKPADKARLRQRLASFLTRRGFTWDVVEPALRTLIKERDE
jgi:regulatory protein